MNWLKRLFGQEKHREPATREVADDSEVNAISQEIREYRDRQRRMAVAAQVDGRHYTEHTEGIKQLKREGKNDEAIALLLRLVDAVERESRAADGEWSIAPWYYEHLAILYRKLKDYSAEVAIIERYEKVAGGSRTKLSDRLVRARELVAKQEGTS